MFRIGKPSITNIEYIKPYICHGAFGFHSTSNDGGINEDLFSDHYWFQIVRLNITICVHKQFHKNPQLDLEVQILKVWSTVYYDILRSCYVHHCHVGWSRVCRFLHLYYTCSTPIVRLLYSTYDVEIKKKIYVYKGATGTY